MKLPVTVLFCFALMAINCFGQDYELVWSDEFDGPSLDMESWSFDIGDGCPDLCGWGNNEAQYYREENLTFDDGKLIITAKDESFGGYNYTSAKFHSRDKRTFTYGKFEARIKLPEGQGIWPAFWLLFNDPTYGGWPHSGEIDIMELVGNDPDVVHGTIHYGGSTKGGSFDLPFENFSDDFHTFTVEWDSIRILWFVDGIQYAGVTKFGIDQGFNWPFDHPFYLIFNVAVGGNWPGYPDASTVFPQTMEVDWVRVYQKGVSTNIGPELPENEVKVLGNPVNNQLLQLDLGDESEARVSLYNTQGQLLLQTNCAQQFCNLNISQVPFGLNYVIVLKNEQVFRIPVLIAE